MTTLLPWVFDLRDRIPALLASYSAGQPGWYRLCARGDLMRPGPRAGLGFGCLAAKVAAQCGLWDQLPEEHRVAWVRHIQGFQLPPDPPGNGMFCDPWVESRGWLRYVYTCLRSRRWRDVFRVNWQNRWAETRQAVSSLLAVGARPLYPIAGFPAAPTEIRAFLERQDWQHPWGAGAQAGHLLFFLKHSNIEEQQRQDGLETVVRFLSEIESPETGGWYRGAIANQEIINGAMKITSGLYWWGIPVRYADALARSAVAQADSTHDCALTNRLFVLHRLTEQLGNPPAGTRAIVEASLHSIPNFVQSDGGVASQPSGSLRTYYYAPVSKGHPVSDLHGLALLSWAIALSAHLVNEQDQLRWRLIAP